MFAGFVLTQGFTESTLGVKDAANTTVRDGEVSLPVCVLRVMSSQSQHDLLVGFVFAQGVTEPALGLKDPTDAIVRNSEVLLPVSVFWVAPNQP